MAPTYAHVLDYRRTPHAGGVGGLRVARRAAAFAGLVRFAERRILAIAVAIIALGLDVVELPRARRLLARHGSRILERTLTAFEREYLDSLGDAAPAFAARLAAKEAVYKALQVLPGARSVGWREIGVRRLPDGRPEIELTGRAAELLAPHAVTIHLSLSHSRDVAAAVVILEG